MRRNREGLTPQEKQFVKAYVRSGDAAYSATKAGYALAEKHGCTVAKRPDVAAEIRKRQLAMLSQDILPVATKLHLQMIQDETIRPADRVNLIKLAYSYTIGKDSPEMAEKSLDDMTPDELEATIELGRASLAMLQERASTIEGKAVEVPDQDDDIFG